MSARKPRVLVARLFHESHTFLDTHTGPDEFEIRIGADLLQAEGDRSPLDAILTTGRSLGWDIVPAIDIFGMPSATARDEVVEMFLRAFGRPWSARPGSTASASRCMVPWFRNRVMMSKGS